MKHIISLVIVLVISNISVAGGPWLKKKGEAYFQFGGGIIPSTNSLFFNGNDFLYTNRKVTDINLGLYTEYGLTNKLTFITEIPFNIVSSSSTLDTISILPVLNGGQLIGLGNVSITPKYQLLDGKLKLSGGVKLSLPTGKYDNLTGLRTAYQTVGIMPILDLGFSKNKYYAFIETGYNYRTELADDFKFELEIGYKIYKNIFAILNFNTKLSTLETDMTSFTNEQTGLYANGQEYSALTLKLSAPLKNGFGINFHTTLLNLHGHLVQRSPSIGGSIYYKLKKN
jgi:hypothetical protein